MQPIYRHIWKFHERHFFLMYTKIVHGKSNYFFFQIMHSTDFHGCSFQDVESLGHATLETNTPEIYTVRKIYKMSALSVNNFAIYIDVNPLVRFWKWNLSINSFRPNALMTHTKILHNSGGDIPLPGYTNCCAELQQKTPVYGFRGIPTKTNESKYILLRVLAMG